MHINSSAFNTKSKVKESGRMGHKCLSIPRLCGKDRTCIPGKKRAQQPAIPGLRCALPQSSGLQCSLGRVWTKTQVIEHRLDSWGREETRDIAFCSFLAVSSFCRSLHILKWLLAREKNVSPGLEDALQHEWGMGQYGGMAGPGRGSPQGIKGVRQRGS